MAFSAPFTGPNANQPGRARRRGRSGYVTDSAGNQFGEVTSVEWSVEIAQINVLIAGTWRDEHIPGAETRTGTFTHQDMDDHFKIAVWKYTDARRRGDRTAVPPEFDMTVVIDDPHSPSATRWQLVGCQLYMYSGGYSNEEDLLTRQIPFSFRDDKPLTSFEYVKGGFLTNDFIPGPLG
jgi:hypothetical protein